MRRYLYTYMAYLMLLMFGMSACTSDGDAPDSGGSASKTYTVHFSLSPASNGSGSRASASQSWETGTDDENMKSWVVAFVGADGKVAALAENNQVSDNNRTKDDVTIEGLTAGTYSVYSFANISATELGLSKGNAASLDDKLWAVNGNDYDVATYGIPMSNKQTVIISDDGTADVTDLWVVRMLSKITLKFKNVSSSDITVNSISISDITDNPATDATNVKLLPANLASSAEAIQTPHLADNAASSEFTHTITGGLTVANTVTNYDADDNGANSVSFYVNESKAGSAYPYFVVTLNTNVGTQRYFMYTDWSLIARNDHHVLKMALSDYQLRLNIEGYSAIGMLPSLEDDGKQLNIAFHMPDEEFHIVPMVTKYSNPGTPISFTNLKWEKLSESETDAEKKAFSSTPALVTGENRIEATLLGELGKKIGPIIYQLSVDVADGSNQITLVYRVAITQDITWYTTSARKMYKINTKYKL